MEVDFVIWKWLRKELFFLLNLTMIKKSSKWFITSQQKDCVRPTKASKKCLIHNRDLNVLSLTAFMLWISHGWFICHNKSLIVVMYFCGFGCRTVNTFHHDWFTYMVSKSNNVMVWNKHIESTTTKKVFRIKGMSIKCLRVDTNDL